jgi:outer membrane lipoprotein-sorting protein
VNRYKSRKAKIRDLLLRAPLPSNHCFPACRRELFETHRTHPSNSSSRSATVPCRRSFRRRDPVDKQRLAYTFKIRTICWLLVFLTVTCCSGWAYVLPGPQIIDLTIKNLGRAQRLKVVQDLTLYDSQTPGDPTIVEEILAYQFPDRFRSEIKSPNGQQIHLYAAGKALQIIDGRTTSHAAAFLDYYKDLLMANTRTRLIDRLMVTGLRVDIASLGRFQLRPAFVVGATYPDESVPQLWIDKETFLPARWLVTGKLEAGLQDFQEIHYEQWYKTGSIYYPMRVTIYVNDIRTRQIRVKHVDVNPSFPSNHFDLDYHRQLYPPLMTAPGQDQPAQASDPIQETIDQFKKIYEE